MPRLPNYPPSWDRPSAEYGFDDLLHLRWNPWGKYADDERSRRICAQWQQVPTGHELTELALDDEMPCGDDVRMRDGWDDSPDYVGMDGGWDVSPDADADADMEVDRCDDTATTATTVAATSPEVPPMCVASRFPNALPFSTRATRTYNRDQERCDLVRGEYARLHGKGWSIDEVEGYSQVMGKSLQYKRRAMMFMVAFLLHADAIEGLSEDEVYKGIDEQNRVERGVPCFGFAGFRVKRPAVFFDTVMMCTEADFFDDALYDKDPASLGLDFKGLKRLRERLTSAFAPARRKGPFSTTLWQRKAFVFTKQPQPSKKDIQ